jgi:hypothetical protein
MGCSSPAFAHSAARGFVLLLPTTHVIVAGAVAVLVSFAIVSMVKEEVFRRAATVGIALGRLPKSLGLATSCASFVVLCLLLWIGFEGPHDPLENMLVLTVWTVWWVVIVLLHPLLGNVWAALNPFSWAAPFGKHCRFPTKLAYVPAVLIFAAFAWFQLVYPAPEDPPRLAMVTGIYATLTLAACIVFGADQWLRKADPFGIFLHQLGAAAPVGQGESGFYLRVPGQGLLKLQPLPTAGMLFVLLTLSSISFDGFSHTFWWLSSIGVNPLEYPGRTALVGANTLGLFGAFLLLVVVYVGAVWLGWVWAGRHGEIKLLMGRLVFSLIPISIAYHFAHYLSDALLNLQYVLLALNDPFEAGAHLLGIEHFHVTASFQNTASGALTLFSAQAAAIVLGHVVGVAVAHAMALDLNLPRRAVLKLEAPLALFMVFYTGFGLWLLATPVAN